MASTILSVESTTLAGAALLLGAAACSDLRSRSIANRLVLALATLGLLRQALCSSPAAALAAAALSFAVLSLLLLPFQRGWLGGGDVKLIAAGCLLFGIRDAFAFLLATALAGGVLSLAALAERRLAGRWGLARPLARTAGAEALLPADAILLPYGLAIAVGGLWVMLVSSASR